MWGTHIIALCSRLIWQFFSSGAISLSISKALQTLRIRSSLVLMRLEQLSSDSRVSYSMLAASSSSCGFVGRLKSWRSRNTRLKLVDFATFFSFAAKDRKENAKGWWPPHCLASTPLRCELSQGSGKLGPHYQNEQSSTCSGGIWYVKFRANILLELWSSKQQHYPDDSFGQTKLLKMPMDMVSFQTRTL